eukprot:8748245-Prorocentrum_lima.AAC.1
MILWEGTKSLCFRFLQCLPRGKGWSTSMSLVPVTKSEASANNSGHELLESKQSVAQALAQLDAAS